MNRKKGFKILTLVLSLLLGPFVFCCLAIYYNDWPHTSALLLAYLFFEAIGFVVVWIIYWIVKGFLDNKKKQISCLWIGISVIVLMGIFPPALQQHSIYNNRYVKYSFILYANGPIVLRHLIVQWIVVTAITGGLIYTFRDNKLKDE